jgi:hypothetical protein
MSWLRRQPHLKARERAAADAENANDWQRLLRYSHSA